MPLSFSPVGEPNCNGNARQHREREQKESEGRMYRGGRAQQVQGRGNTIIQVYIPPVLQMQVGGSPPLDIPHLTKFFEKLQFKNA